MAKRDENDFWGKRTSIIDWLTGGWTARHSDLWKRRNATYDRVIIELFVTVTSWFYFFPLLVEADARLVISNAWLGTFDSSPCAGLDGYEINPLAHRISHPVAFQCTACHTLTHLMHRISQTEAFSCSAYYTPTHFNAAHITAMRINISCGVWEKLS